MAKKQDLNQIEQILSAKKRRLPILPIVYISSLAAIIAMLYFDIFNIFGSEVKEVEYKNEYVVVEKANMATTLTSSGTAKEGSLSNLYSNSSAEVTNVFFDVGDDVKQGDIIISFDDEAAIRNLEMSQSNLDQVTFTLDEFETEVNKEIIVSIRDNRKYQLDYKTDYILETINQYSSYSSNAYYIQSTINQDIQKIAEKSLIDNLFLLEKKYRSWQGSYKSFKDIVKSDLTNNWFIAKVSKIILDLLGISSIKLTVSNEVYSTFSTVKFDIILFTQKSSL